MKKIILIFLIIFLLGIFLCPSFADRNKSTITGYSSSTLIKRGDWKVYRVTYLVTSAGGSFAIYDGLNGGDNSNIKTEGAEAVSLNGKPLDFTNKPLEGSTGLYLILSNCTAIVEYE